jgi:hypothetical protein
MLKQTKTFKDLDGNDVTEDFYFNLTEAELVKLHLAYDEGLEKYIETVIASGKGSKIIELFETLTRAAYGRRTPEGRLLKKPEFFDEITASEGYSQFFMQLVTDADFGSKFVNGIMPADLMEKARKVADQERKQDSAPLTAEDFNPVAPVEPSEEQMLAELGAFENTEPLEKDYSLLTPAELRKLPRHELVAAYKQKNAR